ncbi:MAG TPA: GTP 3',8-cyclase MoaA [Chromatiales bacterium]|nr:GTP 3',8-cyclase MoaA [Chromatiales bacterium]
MTRIQSVANLIDPFGRKIEYLRLSVTDRCDLRCFYCMPEGFKDFEEPAHWLTFDEIERVVGVMTDMGLKRVRITGGEPLVRKDVDTLARRLKQGAGIRDLSLSTNATRLGKHARALREGGVDRLNISLDTLRPERFKDITQGRLDKVLDGILTAKAEGFAPIKINMVAMKGVNDDEIGDMLEFCIEHGFTLRLIETMPMGDTGRSATDHYLDLQVAKKQLAERFTLIPTIDGSVDGELIHGGGPARYMQVAGTDTHIGFITPISQHFCETCNRVRLSVDGTLYMCLGQEHNYPLRDLLRRGIPDDELKEALVAAIGLKPERHEFTEKPGQIVRFMSMTGG